MTITLKPASTAQSAADQIVSLSAPVRDPLWLLARQWQTGGLASDDAGTPVHVDLAHSVTPLSWSGVTLHTPLEPAIEAEPAPAIEDVGTATLVRFAVELGRRLEEAGLPAASAAALRAAWTAKYPLAASTASSPLAVLAAELPSPVALFHLLAASLHPDGTGTFPATLDISAAGTAGAAAVRTAVSGWYAWLSPRVAPPGAASPGVAPAAWNPQQLGYAFSLTASTPAGGLTLEATDHDGAGIDWFTFDAAVSAAPAAPAASSVSVHPAPVAYAGMPRPRFWELEDGDVNLDTMRESADPAHALLATFAHAYANDWFLVPLPDTDAGLVIVTQLAVRDTFGQVTQVQAVADIDAGAGGWHLFELAGAPAARGARVLVPTTATILEGPLLEELLVARDEMANLAWVIDLTTRDGDGQSVDRYQRYLELRPPDDPSFRPVDQSGEPRYLLGTTIPDFWYPLAATTGPGGVPLLAITAKPAGASPVSDQGVQGGLIAKTPGTTIADTEAQREGTRLVRRDRMARTPSGAIAWRARAKDAGRGEAASGLRFDVLE
jgi:hypothetical protein